MADFKRLTVGTFAGIITLDEHQTKKRGVASRYKGELLVHTAPTARTRKRAPGASLSATTDSGGQLNLNNKDGTTTIALNGASGNASLSGDLNCANLHTTGKATVGGDFNCANFHTTGKAAVAKLEVTGDVDIGGTLRSGAERRHEFSLSDTEKTIPLFPIEQDGAFVIEIAITQYDGNQPVGGDYYRMTCFTFSPPSGPPYRHSVKLLDGTPDRFEIVRDTNNYSVRIPRWPSPQGKGSHGVVSVRALYGKLA